MTENPCCTVQPTSAQSLPSEVMGRRERLFGLLRRSLLACSVLGSALGSVALRGITLAVGGLLVRKVLVLIFVLLGRNKLVITIVIIAANDEVARPRAGLFRQASCGGRRLRERDRQRERPGEGGESLLMRMEREGVERAACDMRACAACGTGGVAKQYRHRGRSGATKEKGESAGGREASGRDARARREGGTYLRGGVELGGLTHALV